MNSRPLRDWMHDLYMRSARVENVVNHGRRTFVQSLVASGALGWAALAFGTRLPEVRVFDTKLSMSLGNNELWRLDVRRFSGQPKLRCSASRERSIFALEGAYFPGTKFSPDFEASIRLVNSDLRVTLDFACGLRGDTDLLSWLRNPNGMSLGTLEPHVLASAELPAVLLPNAAEVFVSSELDFHIPQGFASLPTNGITIQVAGPVLASSYDVGSREPHARISGTCVAVEGAEAHFRGGDME